MDNRAARTADSDCTNSARHETILIDSDQAIDWASRFLSVDSIEPVSDTPWARTWRIRHVHGCAYLKAVPSALLNATRSVPALATRFPEVIPAVLASEPERGLLLLADHGGKDLQRKPEESVRSQLLKTYARLQAECTIASSTESNLPDGLPTPDPVALLDELLRFLTPSGPLPTLAGALVHADHFLSGSQCRTYAALITHRAHLLRSRLKNANRLPLTVNHGDLRASNAARVGTRKYMLYDWDEAMAGPAGMSLHALFSGCSVLFEILGKGVLFSNPDALRQPRRELSVYLETLEKENYADMQALSTYLADGALAGMLHYVVGFCRFPDQDRKRRRAVRKNLTSRLSDLLDVCDYLCLNDGGDTLSAAENYVQLGRAWRAERLLAEHCRQHPSDAQAFTQLGHVRLLRARDARAIDAFRHSLEIAPENPPVCAALGGLYAKAGDYRRARRYLRRSCRQQPNEETERLLERVHELDDARRSAALTGVVPSVRFTADELASGVPAPETLYLCDALFRRYGVLHMKQVFDVDLLANCHDTFLQRYRAYLSDRRHKDALRIGDKRFQITIDIAPPYDSPALFGNELVLALMRRVVGKSCILGCFTSAMSLPGSEDQRLHKDHKALFDGESDVSAIPSFAVTVMVPLVDVNEHVGTTLVKKGSHRLTSAQSADLPYQTPLTEIGDCYLMDYRLSHRGQANRSNQPRPILSMVYSRPWFRDYINFSKQPPLRIDAETFAQLPDAVKPLLDWTNEPGPRAVVPDPS
ncbi:MAG: hypothetical protein HKN42_18935 [Granulosicoccus sp.]|nr:hypothetical protein [Granulosicoccus sp.]